MAPLLELTRITKSFGAVRALSGVSFDLRPGEVHALLGENGAGKSTLIKVITGAYKPDSGAIRLDGVLTERLHPASTRALGIAAIYQQPALFPDLSVTENLALTLEGPSLFHRIRWQERQARAHALLQRVGANIDPNSEVRTLTMPEQQLVEIARALGTGARTLIMDEPTASLTASEVTRLMGLIRDLRSQGVGIIYITHRLDEVFEIADRVTVLRDGESVGTREIRSSGLGGPLTETDLIRLMVGREVTTIYPPPEGLPGAEILKLSKVGCRLSGIHDISLELRAGEILGLAGLVGAGRTELAHILFGLTPADTGTITLAGRPVQPRSPREAIQAGIGYLPEDRRRHGVILEMSVAANTTLAIHPTLFPRWFLRFGAERALTEEYLRDLAIKAPSADTCAADLSGGNQQKVALARWLVARPGVLILDEPTQGVDVLAKAEIHRLIRNLTAQGLGVLMISSDLSEILGMSDRIAVMRGGTIIATLNRAEANPHSVMAAAL